MKFMKIVSAGLCLMALSFGALAANKKVVVSDKTPNEKIGPILAGNVWDWRPTPGDQICYYVDVMFLSEPSGLRFVGDHYFLGDSSKHLSAVFLGRRTQVDYAGTNWQRTSIIYSGEVNTSDIMALKNKPEVEFIELSNHNRCRSRFKNN